MPTNSNNLIKINPIKAFSDNYIWALTSQKNNLLVLVDPGDAAVCIDYIKKHNLQLHSILITHHHNDHIGGVEELRTYCQQQQWPLTVYGPALEAENCSDIKLSEGHNVLLEMFDLTFSIIDVPGHTNGHIAYFCEDILFCGDTLFSGGCGRLFEGTPQQMLQSLAKLSNLPAQTRVYCTHEYTLANLTFALTVEPDNVDLIDYYNHVRTLREQNKITLPSTIATECLINPFLRSDNQTIVTSAQEYSGKPVKPGLESFTVIREWKNNF
ncbi:hydroxyacylglutathione hydrolase [Thalassotalea profundi]|uniref:Hydroxyacylglutathione hydrolase n=1 Tax=Thalassotalea profundi TaxID=2036687 RepID=A0ABQ3IK86_9GAMM|nr:hydroxyacylglutathione hydrolase [Thalassotalea profundi]GHE83683.1 hydroxyacylglutathione hydrolase [Thalassotalea profundi]